ncbi:hypothetical protein [Amycolatopsis sp. NPDC004625]|uniref:hypothetical protein n=1 Tax=Amycolatopsis sp. NPDC004625 TaxID=3154670 RepID=UPI0033A99C02
MLVERLQPQVRDRAVRRLGPGTLPDPVDGFEPPAYGAFVGDAEDLEQPDESFVSAALRKIAAVKVTVQRGHRNIGPAGRLPPGEPSTNTQSLQRAAELLTILDLLRSEFVIIHE